MKTRKRIGTTAMAAVLTATLAVAADTGQVPAAVARVAGMAVPGGAEISASDIVGSLPMSVFERGGSRDPLNPPGWALPEPGPPADVEADPAPALDRTPVELRLTGIIRSGGDRLAILNGKILASGERAVVGRGGRRRAVQIVEVTDEDVAVAVGGRTVRVILDRPNAGGAE